MCQESLDQKNVYLAIETWWGQEQPGFTSVTFSPAHTVFSDHGYILIVVMSLIYMQSPFFIVAYTINASFLQSLQFLPAVTSPCHTNQSSRTLLFINSTWNTVPVSFLITLSYHRIQQHSMCRVHGPQEQQLYEMSKHVCM